MADSAERGASTALPSAVLAPQADNAAQSATQATPARLAQRDSGADRIATGAVGCQSSGSMARACGVCRAARWSLRAESGSAHSRRQAATSGPRNGGVVPATAAAALTTSPIRPRRPELRRPVLCELRTSRCPHVAGDEGITDTDLGAARPRRELLFASTARVPRMCTGTTGTPQRLAK